MGRVLLKCRFTSIIVLASGMLSSLGCSADSVSTQQTVSVSDEALTELAESYLYETGMSPDLQEALTAELQALSPGDSVRFFRQLRTLQGTPESMDGAADAQEARMIELDDELNRMTLEAGVNRFLLPTSEVVERIRVNIGIDLDAAFTKAWFSVGNRDGIGVSRRALCLPGYSSCSTDSFQDTGLKYNACQYGCTTGYAYDRVSNESCELGGCDFRVWYATGSVRADRVDGTTAAADCVVNAWPTLINSYSSGSTRILYGWGHTTLCGIYSGSTLQTTTQAWKQ